MKEEYEIETVSPRDYEEWDGLVASSPQGSIFSTTLWMRAMEQATEKPFRIYGCYGKGKLVGGVALQVFKRGPFRVGTMPPLTPFTGIVLSPQQTTKLSLQESRRKEVMDLLSDRLTEDFSLVLFNNHPSLRDPRPLKWKEWRVGVNYTYYVDLRDMDKLWQSIDRNTRTQIRKAKSLGMSVSPGGDISGFYRIYKETFSHKGLSVPVEEQSLRKVYDSLKDRNLAKLYLAENSTGEAISAYICVWDNRRGYFWVGGTDPKFRATQVTTLVYWSILQDISGFLPEVDLSGGNTLSIAKFQRDFASTLEPYYVVERSSRVAGLAFGLYRLLRKRRAG